MFSTVFRHVRNLFPSRCGIIFRNDAEYLSVTVRKYFP